MNNTNETPAVPVPNSEVHAVQPQPTEQVQPEKPKRLVDAIAIILKADSPMGATDIAKAILSRGLWPADKSKDLSKATWNAIVLEIQQKGDASRFAKVEGQKGKYTFKGN